MRGGSRKDATARLTPAEVSWARNTMQQQRLSFAQLAARAGHSPETVRHIVYGSHNTTPDKLAAVLKALGGERRELAPVLPALAPDVCPSCGDPLCAEPPVTSRKPDGTTTTLHVLRCQRSGRRTSGSSGPARCKPIIKEVPFV